MHQLSQPLHLPVALGISPGRTLVSEFPKTVKNKKLQKQYHQGFANFRICHSTDTMAFFRYLDFQPPQVLRPPSPQIVANCITLTCKWVDGLWCINDGLGNVGDSVIVNFS